MAVGSSNTIQFGSMAMMPAMADPLFLPAGKLVRRMLPIFIHIHGFQSVIHPLRISAEGTPMFSGPKATSSSTMLATSWLSGFC